MKFACSRCGSRQWPDPDSSCPLCRGHRQELDESIESAARDAGQNSQSKQTNDMKKTLNTEEIARALHRDDNANWSWNGARALAEYLEQLEEDTGEELELDVCAIRCDFSEYESLLDWATDYFMQWRGDLNIDPYWDEKGDLERIEDVIRSYIQDHGMLIEFTGGVIVSSF